MAVRRADSPWKSARRDDADARRELILRTASRHLNERGWKGASMSAMAAELGLSTNAFYHYFTNKQEILLRCFERAQELIDTRIGAAEQQAGPGIAKVKGLVIGVRELIAVEPMPMGLLAVHLSAANLQSVGRRSVRHGERVSALLQLGVADGSIRRDNVRIIAALLLNGLYSLPYPRLTAQLGEKRFREELLAFIERALSP